MLERAAFAISREDVLWINGINPNGTTTRISERQRANPIENKLFCPSRATIKCIYFSKRFGPYGTALCCIL